VRITLVSIIDTVQKLVGLMWHFSGKTDGRVSDRVLDEFPTHSSCVIRAVDYWPVSRGNELMKVPLLSPIRQCARRSVSKDELALTVARVPRRFTDPQLIEALPIDIDSRLQPASGVCNARQDALESSC
jgi:hypothetical protein